MPSNPRKDCTVNPRYPVAYFVLCIYLFTLDVLERWSIDRSTTPRTSGCGSLSVRRRRENPRLDSILERILSSSLNSPVSCERRQSVRADRHEPHPRAGRLFPRGTKSEAKATQQRPASFTRKVSALLSLRASRGPSLSQGPERRTDGVSSFISLACLAGFLLLRWWATPCQLRQEQEVQVQHTRLREVARAALGRNTQLALCTRYRRARRRMRTRMGRSRV